MGFAVIAFIQGYFSKIIFNIFVSFALVALIVGTYPYIRTMRQEDRALSELIHNIGKSKSSTKKTFNKKRK